MSTQTNNYKPTPAEEKLLLVLLNPEVVGLNVTQKCELAGIDRGVYYTAMKKHGFLELLNVSTMDMLKGEMNDIVKAFAIKAREGSYNHGKLLLEMGNLYTQKNVIEGNMNLNVSIEDVIAAISKEEDGEEDGQ